MSWPFLPQAEAAHGRSQAVSLQGEMARENGPSHSGLGSHIASAWLS